MLNPQFIGRVALPIFAAVLPFNSNGPGLAVSRSWAFFWISLAALTAVQGFFYNGAPPSVPGSRADHRDRRVPRMAHRTRGSRRRGRGCIPARMDRREAKGKGPRGVTRGPFSCLRSSGSRCIRSRPAAPQHRCWNRSRGCSTDPRTTGSCTRRPAPLRSVAPRCCGNG